MKRIFSLFAAAILAALAILPAAALAAGGPVVFSMNSVENVAPGESFTVTLSISGEYQAHGMNLSIEFDPNSMVLESCTEGDYLTSIKQNQCIVVLDAETLAPAGKIKLGVICPLAAASGSGSVLEMKFHVKEGVTVNQQVIMVIHEFIYMPLEASSSTPVPFSTHNSIITLRGGATPEAGYNEGDDGIGNNISSSPSLPPEPTPAGSGNTPAPIATVAPVATPVPGTTPSGEVGSRTAEPKSTPSAAGESAQPAPAAPITASPDGAVTASPTQAAEDPESTAGSKADTPKNTDGPADTGNQQSGDGRSKSSPLPFIAIGAAVVAAASAAAVVISKKKRG